MDHQKLEDECKAKFIKLPQYILECPDRTLRYRALLVLAKGHEDRDQIIVQCKKAYESVHQQKLKEANEKALEQWAEFLKYKDKL